MSADRENNRIVARVPWFIRRRLGLRSKSQYLYDSLVKVRVGSDAYMLTDAVDIQHLLVTNAHNYVKPPQLTGPKGRARAGTGLLTSTGPEHRRQRLLLQPLFHQRIVETFADVIEDRTRRALARWWMQPEIDVAREMSELALSNLMGMLFGIDFEDEGGRLAEAIRARRRYTEYVYHSRLPFRERLPTRTVREHCKALETIDATIYRSIEARRKSGARASDMLSLLMRAEYPDGSHMTDRQIRDEVLTLTSTGHETIGDALGWTWYLIVQNSKVEEKLLVELAQVLDGRPVRAADFAKLEYAQRVLSESLRLYPPTWIYARVPLADDVLPSGCAVRAGSTILLSPYLLHRHPRYFPDPESFDPERFLENEIRKRPKFAYFPFGGGPHICIGEVFARLEGVLVLAHVAPLVRFQLLPRQQIAPEAGVTLYPKHGIRVRLLARG